jgi:hypothetical protein
VSTIPRKLRRLVVGRAGNRCEYCRFPAVVQPAIFDVDHIRPRSRGGRTVAGNLALACPRCNGAKLDRVRAIDPVSERTVALFNPRVQCWNDHFQWSPENPVVLEGKTPIGRATVVCLQMNHPEMLTARSFLAALGLLDEPPP